jgi:GST-like protein
MITLYTLASISPNIRKVLMMLEETGLPYRIEAMEKHGGGTMADGFRAMSPNGTVPVIVDEDNGCSVFESAAILVYLADKSRKFLPDEIGARGEVLQWLLFEAANVGPVMGELYHYMLYAPDEMPESVLHRYQERLAKYCTSLDRRLEGREFLSGQYSIADMALFPWTVVLEDIGEIELARFPNLAAWAARIGERAAAQADGSSKRAPATPETV